MDSNVYCNDCLLTEVGGDQQLTRLEKVILFYQSRGYDEGWIAGHLKLPVRQIKANRETGRKKINIDRGDSVRVIWFVEQYLLTDLDMQDRIQEELRKRDTWTGVHEGTHYMSLGRSRNGSN